MALNDDILDRAISHEIGLRRYGNRTLREFIAILNRVDDRLVAEIARRGIGDPSFSQRRLELLLDAVRKMMADIYTVAQSSLTDNLRGLAGNEIDYQTAILKNLPPIKLDVISPAPQQVYAAVKARPFQGRVMKELYKDLEVGAFKRVRDEIRTGFVEGRTNDQIIRSIRGTRAGQFKDGILEINRRGASTMVRTALNHTANVARSETFKANRSVLKGEQWHATLDNRTSAVCRGRDGKVYPVGTGPRPPAHLNCRSVMIPVSKSWKELGINLKEAPAGTRASMNGQVPSTLTYNDWLKKQPVGFQDDILGKTKGQLYRKGDLPLDRFIDRAGKEYTLAELKIREAAAFTKAGI